VVVTGAAGYIGSHAALALLERGHRVLGIDNMVRGNPHAIEVLRSAANGRFEFAPVDVLDQARLTELFRAFGADAVIHFAALSYVGESVQQPLLYWHTNLGGSLSLLAASRACGIERFVFSSTCSTYGVPDASELPIRESCPQRPINPYGRSKLAFEQALLDEHAAQLASPHTAQGTAHGAEQSASPHAPFSLAILRYFNVAGCDPKGRLGEDHRPETHLIPVCLEVALGQRTHVDLLGEDYETPDGTCVRDYVHVSDLVDAHLLALDRLSPTQPLIANIGIGCGFSVREVLDACRRVTGKPIPHRSAPRRAGDPPTLLAEATHARRALAWSPRFMSLDETVATAWAWRSAHPNGYPR